ncbi:MAG: hypothetical protein AB1726_12135 [Planctomycetota bacterium]
MRTFLGLALLAGLRAGGEEQAPVDPHGSPAHRILAIADLADRPRVDGVLDEPVWEAEQESMLQPLTCLLAHRLTALPPVRERFSLAL